MSQEKYIGMDVHQATISVAVMDAGGKVIMECLLQSWSLSSGTPVTDPFGPPKSGTRAS